MRKHEIVKAKFAAIAALSQRARVALGCCMVEHTFDLYRLGPLKHRVADFPAIPLAAAADADVVEYGLGLAWRFAAVGSHEPAATTALIAVLKTAFKTRPDEPELMLPGVGPIVGTMDTLTAITDQTPSPIEIATGRTIVGISRLTMLDLDDSDAVPAREQDEESEWQLRVAQRLVASGDKPITRDLVADLLAEQLTWHKRLDSYAAQCREIAAK